MLTQVLRGKDSFFDLLYFLSLQMQLECEYFLFPSRNSSPARGPSAGAQKSLAAWLATRLWQDSFRHFFFIKGMIFPNIIEIAILTHCLETRS